MVKEGEVTIMSAVHYGAENAVGDGEWFDVVRGEIYQGMKKVRGDVYSFEGYHVHFGVFEKVVVPLTIEEAAMVHVENLGEFNKWLHNETYQALYEAVQRKRAESKRT